MPRLHLLRHAKSDREDGIDDRDRPLSRRGRDTARQLAESLPAALGDLDLVLCSTALRARETAELALAGFAAPPRMLFEEGLYLAGRGALLRRLAELDAGFGSVLVVGHNPGLHELAIALADKASPAYQALAGGKFPTAARASFALAEGWAEIDRSRHRLIDYATPKSLGISG